MSGRRGLRTAVLLCLVGACLVLLAVGRSWVTVDVALTADITAVGEAVAGETDVSITSSSVWASAPASAAPTAPAPEPAGPLTEKGLWEALDRGEDPTANLGTLAGPPADREADRT